jgi:hypothetical protein
MITNSGDISTDWKRWRKRAIDSSAKQIYGAERWIEGAPNVIRSDGSVGIRLPEKKNRRIHRVAIALGDQGETPIKFGDLGKGFVHVFDKISLNIIMGELDTIEDFVEYLSAKERLYLSGKKTLFHGGEEDLLALYLHKGRQFPDEFDVLVVDDNLWQGFKENEAYKAKKEADEISYAWDRLIEILCRDILHCNLEFGPELNVSEIAVRTMARENRFGRRLLGKSFVEFYELARQKKVRSRMALGNSNTTYVFLGMPHGEDRAYRKAELGGRCLVARGLNEDRDTVIGLATRHSPVSFTHLEYIYATLASWGMHRMGRGGSKMQSFDTFCQSIEPLKGRISDAQRFNFSSITNIQWEILKEVFQGINVMASEGKKAEGSVIIRRRCSNHKIISKRTS